jgi:hypothetical protein
MVATSVAVPPTFTAGALGVTVTDATGTSDTVIAACADFPSLDAAMVAVPTATPVTTPFASTVATAEDDVVHAIARPDRTPPAASRATALSCVVFPMTTLAVAGVTDTLLTGVGLPPPLSGAEGESPSPPQAAMAKAQAGRGGGIGQA